MKVITPKQIILSLLLFLATIPAGYYLTKLYLPTDPSADQPSDTQENLNQNKLTLYFLREDGIYSLTDTDPEPTKVVPLEYSQEAIKNRNTPFSYDLMGENRDILVYQTIESYNPDNNQLRYGLKLYDTNKKQVIRSITPKEGSTISSYAVSPSGNQLAYLEVQWGTQGPQSFESSSNTLTLYSLDGSSRIILTYQTRLGGLSIGRFITENRITIGNGWEGIGYCALDLLTATEYPNPCNNYGSSYIGKTDLIRAISQDYLFGSKFLNQDLSNQKDATGIYKTDLNFQNREYLTSDLTAELVYGNNTLYYLKNPNNSYSYNGAGVDLYAITIDGQHINRLTNDSTTVTTKSNLSLGNNSRFLAYQTSDISKIATPNNTFSDMVNNTQIWLYDTKLNKYYQVVNKGLMPKLSIN